MSKLLLISFSLSLLLSCQGEYRNDGEVIATAFGNRLYKEDLQLRISASANAADSASLMSKHIDNWLMEEILYNEAKAKITNVPKVNRLVDDYRKSLYLYELEKLQLAEALDTSISVAELDTFYNLHKTDFLLDETIIKLLFVKVPEAMDNEELKTLWKTENVPALRSYVHNVGGIERLEINKWLYLSEVNNISPPELLAKIKFDNSETYSLTQDGFRFLIKVLDYAKPNELAPKSFALPKIKRRLLHDRSSMLLNSWKKELYQNNIKSKDININSQN